MNRFVLFVLFALLTTFLPFNKGFAQEANVTQKQMQQLANDANFQQLIKTLKDLDNRISARLEKLPKADQGKWVEQLEALIKDIESGNNKSSYPDLLEEFSGFTEKEYEELQAMKEQFNREYPDFDTPAEVGETVETYLEDDVEEEEECDSADSRFCLCLQQCYGELRSGRVGIRYSFTSNRDAVGLGFLLQFAVNQYNQARLWYNDQCIAGCELLYGEPECQDDTDCNEVEFCAKPIGAKSRCELKRSLDAVCSRDGKCRSGCCRYNALIDIFSKVCRPADKCD